MQYSKWKCHVRALSRLSILFEECFCELLRGEIKSTVTVQYFCSSVLVNEVRWNITMELLSQYVSSSSQSENSDDQLQPAKVRSVYLITYSQADLSIFPNRQSFADAVCEAVLNCEGPKTKVTQWTCCQENHKRQGKHYHMVIKLNKIKRWLPIWQYLKNKWSVYVHFSNWHTNYYSAWLYTTKEDEDFIQSAGHPDLGNSGPPRTMAASQARVKRRQPIAELHDSATDTGTSGGEGEGGEEREQEDGRSPMKGKNVSKTSVKRKRSKWLSCYEVSNIILEKKIQNRTELLALASAQKAEGKTDLAEFVMNRGNRVVEECISTAWEMEKASELLQRSKLTRLQFLEKCLQDPCTAEWVGGMRWRVGGMRSTATCVEPHANCGFYRSCEKSPRTGEGKILQHFNQGPCQYRQDIST